MRLVEIVPVPGSDEYERDKGKTFVIKEMPALYAEKWAWRMLLALAKAGADVDMIKGSGMAGLAMAGIQAIPNLNFEDAEPLMDEMVPYIRVLPPAATSTDWEHGRVLILNSKDGDGDDIDEIATWLLLRSKFIEVHTRFFTKGARSNSTSETAPTPPVSSSVPTSPAPSQQ